MVTEICVSYGLSIADNMNGPWFQASGYTFFNGWDKYSLPSSRAAWLYDYPFKSGI